MATTAYLVARSGDLKRELVRYAQQPRYARAFQEALLSQDDLESVVADEQKMIMAMDHFVLQHRLGDGETVVEQFVAAHPHLPDAERDMMLGWRDVVEGIFEVERRDGDVLVMSNLIDDLTYRVHSNMGPAVFSYTPRRSFLITRLVPVAGEWLISGATSLFPASPCTVPPPTSCCGSRRSCSVTRTRSPWAGRPNALNGNGSSASSARIWLSCPANNLPIG
jgi:hypothetical protein